MQSSPVVRWVDGHSNEVVVTGRRKAEAELDPGGAAEDARRLGRLLPPLRAHAALLPRGRGRACPPPARSAAASSAIAARAAPRRSRRRSRSSARSAARPFATPSCSGRPSAAPASRGEAASPSHYVICEKRISVTMSSSADLAVVELAQEPASSSTRRICGLSCSISRGESSRERLHLDLVDDRVEDALALAVARAAEHGHDHALPVLRRLVAEADRGGLATGAELLGDGRVVEVEGERRHRRPRQLYEGRPAAASRARLRAISRSPL